MENRTAANVSYAAQVRAGEVRFFKDSVPPPVITEPEADPEGEWRSLAACMDEDTERFFPEKDKGAFTRAELADIDKVKQICGRCAVKLECDKYAREHQMQYGIWGGTSPGDRPGTPAYRERQRKQKQKRVADSS